MTALEELRVRLDAVFIGLLPPRLEIGEFRKLIELLDDIIFMPLRPSELDYRLLVAEWRALARSRSSPSRSVPMPLIDRRVRERRKDCLLAGPGSSAAASTAGFRIDAAARIVYWGEKEVHLTPKEYEVLHLLASHPGRTFTWQEILAACWARDCSATADNVHQYIARLRRRFEDNSEVPRLIRNVRGFGYRLQIPAPPLPDTEVRSPRDVNA